jgi:hypothetical protein
MKEVYTKKRAGLGVISGAVVAIVVGILACCNPPAPVKYVLTVQNNGNCTTIPSGTVLVDPGASTSIQARADAGHTWDATSGWTVVSGTAVIANDAQSGTTVTLSAGDATIEAHCP